MSCKKDNEFDGVSSRQSRDHCVPVEADAGVDEDVFLSPLQFDVVLAEILDLVSLSDLASCRLVSSQWNRLAIQSMKRRRPIISLDLDDSFLCNKTRRTDLFIEVMSSSPNIPYSGFKLMNSMFGMSDPVFQKFLDVCGNSIKTLILDIFGSSQCSSSSTDTDDFISLIKRLACNLEVLDFDDFSTEIAYPTKKRNNPFESSDQLGGCNIKQIIFPAVETHLCTDWWFQIFSFTNNLHTIHINHTNQTLPLFEALVKAGRLGQIRNLRMEDLGQKQLNDLLSVDLVLEEFKFNIICEDVSIKKLEQLLKKLSEKLKVLAMGSPDKNKKIILNFPKMPKLRRLGLFHCDDSLILLPSLKFHDITPRLRVLEVSSGIKHLDWQEYLSYNINISSPSCTTVEELKIGLLVCDPQCIYYLGKIFPNIKKLSLEFPRRDFLQAVWATTTLDLEELSLYFHVTDNDCKDRSLFGLETDWKTSVRSQCDTSLPDWWKNIDPPPPIVNSICNLTNLQRLSIEESPNCGKDSDLTDFSVYFGFIRLRNLRVIKIGRSQITAPAKQFLLQSLPMISELDIQDADGSGLFSLEERDELISYMNYYEEDYEQEYL